MLLVEIQKKRQPVGEIRVLPAPTQEKEEDLTNSMALRKKTGFRSQKNIASIRPAFASFSQIPRDGATVKFGQKETKIFNISLNLNILAFFSNKIGADFI